jgi:glutamate dehydrogenase/leucine dehydrogenase
VRLASAGEAPDCAGSIPAGSTQGASLSVTSASTTTGLSIYRGGVRDNVALIDTERCWARLMFEELLETWDGETVVVNRDRESGSWIFVCLHSTRRGPAGGGTRMKVYGTLSEALQDAMRLSAAMTRKLAVAGLPFGGGKGVIAVREIPSGEERRALFLRYADLVASLGGTFRTSSDMNTGETDMDVISERTEYVFRSIG